MKSQVLHTVWCNIAGESEGEIWTWYEPQMLTPANVSGGSLEEHGGAEVGSEKQRESHRSVLRKLYGPLRNITETVRAQNTERAESTDSC